MAEDDPITVTATRALWRNLLIGVIEPPLRATVLEAALPRPTAAELDPGCKCGRRKLGRRCRCMCERCGSRKLSWTSWGSYLDRDLVCGVCGRTQDVWDC